jgi:hypothetical protein
MGFDAIAGAEARFSGSLFVERTVVAKGRARDETAVF